jgi:DNA/RNA-binding domain of Phe-tRNA-synthetase-like protein
LKEKQLQLDSEIERLQSLVQNKLTLLNTEQPITAEDLNKIVEETVQIYVAEAGSTIQHLIEQSQENLVYEFEKSAVGQEMNRNVKTSGGKAKSPGNVLGKKKVKVAKPAKG